jgi:hypothetical protein
MGVQSVTYRNLLWDLSTERTYCVSCNRAQTTTVSLSTQEHASYEGHDAKVSRSYHVELKKR